MHRFLMAVVNRIVPQPFRLQTIMLGHPDEVPTLSSSSSSTSSSSSHHPPLDLNEIPSSSILLDVDLDFFSTLNPFRAMLTPKQVSRAL